MRYYLIAGEASGDMHAARLVAELKLNDPNLEVRAWGGDKLAAEGAIIVKHIRELAFMGFVEVIKNLPTILGFIKECKAGIEQYKPDVVIFVDYPGFNFRIADWAKSNGYKTVWYISPQLWAWKEGRVKIVKRSVDLMIVILPFEKEFYRKHGVDVVYVGHPLLDAFDNPSTTSKTGDTIALLPGSRKQEIRSTLPVMIEGAKSLGRYQPVIAQAPSVDAEFYQSAATLPSGSLSQAGTRSIVPNARVAAVTSGTATLETALLGTPEVVCYRAGAISVWLAKRMIKVKYISLVNLILDRPLVTELIQEDFTADRLSAELDRISDGADRSAILEGYAELRDVLGGAGASARAASAISEFLRGQ